MFICVVHMCVVCACVYVCACLCVFVCAHACLYRHIHVFVYFMYTLVCEHVHAHTHKHRTQTNNAQNMYGVPHNHINVAICPLQIPGGLKSQSSIISGVVCTKVIAHKRMKHNIPNPKILLLRGPIEYQRVENKFSSLEPQILQVIQKQERHQE